MCGEKFIRNAELPLYTGSPPRVRGKDTRHCDNRITNRITPACAGKSAELKWAIHRFWDHPRVCGEKESLSAPAPPQAGSPPRVRGKGFNGVERGLNARITPACAGKRRSRRRLRSATRDHPRVCGEKGNLRAVCLHVKGSPPRVRGKGAGAQA